MDSSQSPLALLAQTCSSIGKEPSTTTANVTLPKATYPSNNEKTTSKLNEIINTEKRSDHTSHHHGHHHKNEKLSPTTKVTSSYDKSNNNGILNLSTTNFLAKPNQDNASTPSSSSSMTTTNGLEIKKSQQSITTSSSRYTFEPQSYYNSLADCLPRTTVTTPSSLPSFTHSYMAAAAYSSLLDPYLALLRADSLRSAALLAAYTPKEETNLNLTCSDPYCRHCLLAHSQLSIPCTIPSCLQCELVRQPFVCNWISARDSTYCGKRYSTTDELLTHLRTAHTQDYYQSALTSSRSPTKPIPTHRFHPYTKPTITTNTSPSSMQNSSNAAAAALANLPPHHFGFYPNLPLFGSR
ncbi:unnamed protein product [Didymodactylos carnosus]|uniref:C2H2-type domain-containing protein n=1 Tax=Didymodactylos carnosus TaxID=1234261 RepID=A0A8S2FYI1_9BILA|nr:unnamed protein product [Didymodactylos carnosus]CAF4364041.1 unnamed protein product [Didymodactylos carnosus]